MCRKRCIDEIGHDAWFHYGGVVSPLASRLQSLSPMRWSLSPASHKCFPASRLEYLPKIIPNNYDSNGITEDVTVQTVEISLHDRRPMRRLSCNWVDSEEDSLVVDCSKILFTVMLGVHTLQGVSLHRTP